MISTVLCYSATSGSFVAEYGTSCRVDMGNVGLILFLPLRHPVADAGLGEDVGGVVRVVAQLVMEGAYNGAPVTRWSSRARLIADL